jgi:8-oxo-dGTP pyrophosphatase MutT (NUDIX family)
MQKEETFGDVIRAAGGLVWRDSADARRKEVAVIRRSRYSGEGWTLPKGKVKPEDKSWKEAAEREVGEETGCEVRADGFVGCNSYIVKGTPKVVLFWTMSLTGKPHPKDSGEVKEVEWIAPEDGLEMLHYPGERALVSGTLETADAAVVSAPEVKKKWWRSTSWNRLATSLRPYCLELELLISSTKRPDSPWVSTARSLLVEAGKALKEGNDELGWKCFLAAQRVELSGLSEDALHVRAHSILNESNRKLGRWRKKSVVDLLAQKPAPGAETVEPKAKVTVEEAYEAALILHEHYSNVQHRLRFHKRLLGALALIALIALAVWVGVVLRGFRFDVGDAKLLPSVMLFGIMGASFSGILSLSKGVSEARIPEQLANTWITLARQVVGVVSALVAYSFLSSGLLKIGGIAFDNPHLILAVSFAAGFSERLVVRAAETLSQQPPRSNS